MNVRLGNGVRMGGGIFGFPIATSNPDRLSSRDRLEWGALIEGNLAQYPDFFPQNDSMFIYENGGGLVRATIRKDEVADTDTAGTERAEIQTATVSTVGSKPEMGLDFEVWIPSSLPVPGGTSSIVIAQLKYTSGDALQIIFHQSGVIRFRKGTAGATELVAAPLARGRWHKFSYDIKVSKGVDGQLIVKHNDVAKHTALNAANVYPAALSDAAFAYWKLGAYRASALTDATRGDADIWLRNIVLRAMQL